MELIEDILNKEGEFVSLGQIIKTGCLLTKQCNKKTLDSRMIQFSIRMHFTEDKRINSIKSGTNKVTKWAYFQKEMEDENFKNSFMNVKKLVPRFDITKVSKSAIFYLLGIFKNINAYQMEEYEYDNNIDIKKFLKCSTLVAEAQRVRTIKEKHFEDVKEILCPHEEMNLVWSIDKTEKEVNNFIEENFDGFITKNFLKKLICLSN